jgi:transcription-repair coupling factor (superfamily II helicase)
MNINKKKNFRKNKLIYRQSFETILKRFKKYPITITIKTYSEFKEAKKMNRCSGGKKKVNSAL